MPEITVQCNGLVLPWGPSRFSYQRGDLILHGTWGHEQPIDIEFGLTRAGEVYLRRVGPAHAGACPYICAVSDELLPEHPTPEQQASLAAYHFGNGPYGLYGPSRPLLDWACAGLSNAEIEQLAGVTGTIYYTAPDRGVDDSEDQVARQESLLELACESGLLPGAAPADI